MNLLLADSTRSREATGTSAEGAMRATRAVQLSVIVLSARTDLGTASSTRNVSSGEQFELEWNRTSSGDVRSHTGDRQDTGPAILELRRLTGLTWEQLARLFGVARRSLHFWASGKPLNAANEELLFRALSVVRIVDRGTASENRMLLFQECQGLIPFDLLVERQFEEVLALIGAGPGSSHRKLPPQSPESRAARRPLPPEVLADALQDTVHREVGRGRAARVVKAKRRGQE